MNQTLTRRVIYVAAFLRSLGIGLIGVKAALHLTSLGLTQPEIGTVLSSGLFGIAASSALVTFYSRQFSTKPALIGLSLVGFFGALGFFLSSDFVPLCVFAFFGMLNALGRDRGAQTALETALLPETTDENRRTAIIATHTMFLSLGGALGSLLSALPSALLIYLVLIGASALAYFGLPQGSVAARSRSNEPLTPKTKSIVRKISALFFVDAFGGGFLASSFIALFFTTRFQVSPVVLGGLFFTVKILNGMSHLLAARISRKIGLVNTMVFTHIPASLLLMTATIAPSFTVAAVLFLIRESLTEMDVPTRTSYLMAVVRPEERTFVSSFTTLARLVAWATAPVFAGFMMKFFSMETALVFGAGLKIVYDLLLYRAFIRVKPPEELLVS
jgi:predicted MFS family arabinose efflux permease